MSNYNHLECSIEASLRIAERSCTRYAPTTQLQVIYEGISVTKRGTFTYGDVIDFSVPCTCFYSSEEVLVWNYSEDGFALDLVTINVNGNQHIYDASTYTTWDLDMHLKNDACWYYDNNSQDPMRWGTPLVFDINT